MPLTSSGAKTTGSLRPPPTPAPAPPDYLNCAPAGARRRGAGARAPPGPGARSPPRRGRGSTTSPTGRRPRRRNAAPRTARRQVAEGLPALPHGAREIDRGAMGIGRVPAGADRPGRHRQPGDDPPGAGKLVGAHLLEVAGAEKLVGRE